MICQSLFGKENNNTSVYSALVNITNPPLNISPPEKKFQAKDEVLSVLHSILDSLTSMVQRRALMTFTELLFRQIPFGEMFCIQAAVLQFDDNLKKHGWSSAIGTLLQNLSHADLLPEEHKKILLDNLAHFFGETAAKILSTPPESFLSPEMAVAIVGFSVLMQRIYYQKNSHYKPITLAGKLLSQIVKKITFYQKYVLPVLENAGPSAEAWGTRRPLSGTEAMSSHSYEIIEQSFFTLLINYIQAYWPVLGIGGTLISVGTYTGLEYLSTEASLSPLLCDSETPAEFEITTNAFPELTALPHDIFSSIVSYRTTIADKVTTEDLINTRNNLQPTPPSLNHSIEIMNKLLSEGLYSEGVKYLVQINLQQMRLLCNTGIISHKFWNIAYDIVSALFLLNLTATTGNIQTELLRLREEISKRMQYIDLEKAPSFPPITLSEEANKMLGLYIQSLELYREDGKALSRIIFSKPNLRESDPIDEKILHALLLSEFKTLKNELEPLFNDVNNSFCDRQWAKFNFNIVHQMVSLKLLTPVNDEYLLRMQRKRSIARLVWTLQDQFNHLCDKAGNLANYELKHDYRDVYFVKKHSENHFPHLTLSERLILSAINYRLIQNPAGTRPEGWSALTTIRIFIEDSHKLNPLEISLNLPANYLPFHELKLDDKTPGTRPYTDVINDYIETSLDYQSHEISVELLHLLGPEVNLDNIIYPPRQFARYEVRNQTGHVIVIELHSGDWLVLAAINSSIKIKHYTQKDNSVLNILKNPLNHFGYINELCGAQCSMNYLFYPYDIKMTEVRTPGVHSITPSDKKIFEKFWQSFYEGEDEVIFPHLRFLHTQRLHIFASRQWFNPFVIAEDKGLNWLLESQIKQHLLQITQLIKNQRPDNLLHKAAAFLVPYYEVIYSHANDRNYSLSPLDIQSLILDSISFISFLQTTGTRISNSLAIKIVHTVRRARLRGLRGNALAATVLKNAPNIISKTATESLPDTLSQFYKTFEPVPVLEMLKGIYRLTHHTGKLISQVQLLPGGNRSTKIVKSLLSETPYLPPRTTLLKYIEVDETCYSLSSRARRGACVTKQREDISFSSAETIINGFYQTLDDIRRTDPTISARHKYLNEFNVGSLNHRLPEYTWMDSLSTREKLSLFNSGIDQRRTPQELGPVARGALGEKILIELKEIERTGLKKSMDIFFSNALQNWGGSQTLSLAQAEYIKDFSPGLCKPLSSMMALAIEKGTLHQFASALRNLTAESQIYHFMDAFQRGEEVAGNFKKKVLQPSSTEAVSATHFPDETVLFSEATSSAELSTSVHAMSVTKVVTQRIIIYHFYDPNFGIVSFSKYDQMAGFIKSHLLSLKIKSDNPYQLQDNLMVKRMNFDEADALLSSTPSLHRILLEHT